MRFTELASVQTINNEDVFAVDGNNGTKNYSFGNLKTQLKTLNKTAIAGLNMDKSLTCYERMGFVELIYTGNITAISANQLIKLATIPEGYRPIEQVDSSITNNERTIMIRVMPDGTLYGYNYGEAITKSNNFSFNITYIAAD